MINAGKCMVVNFSSDWGRNTEVNEAPYCASEWAIEGLSKAMALELPEPLTCVPLNPGIINTAMSQISDGKEAASLERSPEEWGLSIHSFHRPFSEWK